MYGIVPHVATNFSLDSLLTHSSESSALDYKSESIEGVGVALPMPSTVSEV